MTFLYGVSQFLFSALALAVVLSLFASYFVAMTVVPLFCAQLHQGAAPCRGAPVDESRHVRSTGAGRLRRTVQSRRSTRRFDTMLDCYERCVRRALTQPGAASSTAITALFARQPGALSVARRGVLPAHRCRPVRDQPEGALRAPASRSPTADVEQVEALVRQRGRTAGPRTDRLEHRRDAGLLVDLHEQLRPAHRHRAGARCNEDHAIGSYEYMDARAAGDAASELPQLSAYFQSGGMVDAVLNLGLPAPIDVQVSGSNLEAAYRRRRRTRREHPEAARRQRRLHPAGHRLPVAAARHRSRARASRARAEPARGREQRHHGAHLEPDDRAELLGRSATAATTTC